MLIRLKPAQASHMWPSLMEQIERAWPPTVYDVPQRGTNLLEDVLAAQAHVWIGFASLAGAIGICVTNFVVDRYGHQQSLQILALVGLKAIPDEFYAKSLVTLKRFAVQNKCTKICAYVSDARLLGLLNEIGADTSFHFIELNTLKD